jgi:hypothetical protein
MKRLQNPLKFSGNHPIKGNGMVTSFSAPGKLLIPALILATGMAGAAEAKREVPSGKKPVPVVAAEAKNKASLPAASPNDDFQEIDFGKALIIEGKVEKPQVQFPLIKEPPPEKEIQFETSFLQNILKLDRENTFKAGERYGRE